MAINNAAGLAAGPVADSADSPVNTAVAPAVDPAVDPAGDAAADLAVGAALFRGLADPTRLAILRRLARGEARVVELTTTVGLAQSTVSGHLACLRDCGLITARPQGRQMFYALAYPELLDLLTAAEKLLDATGRQVVLCPVTGMNSTDGDTRTD
ncbi:MAG TPA: metalloregulator ArsR/SmtB family transcription factor [Amycolatopsis sp.]|nr:metalloregulator ArsR/SmtB family transcription factor [Amycolatopsis sp.]